MIVKQILLAFTLLIVAFVLEVTRRVVTGDQPTTFSYGYFLWILLFVSAQPPFLSRSLRRPYKVLALVSGFIAGVVFDSLLGPPLLGPILGLVKGVPGSLFGAIAFFKLASVFVSYLVSKARGCASCAHGREYVVRCARRPPSRRLQIRTT